MSFQPLHRWFLWLAFIASLVASGGTPSVAEASRASQPSIRATDTVPASPLSTVPLAVVTPLWGAIERRVFSGVCQGVAGFRFEIADQDDVSAIAMERAWRSFSAAEEPIRNPEAWGKTIAVRVSLDELRRKKRDRVRLAAAADADAFSQADLVEQHADALPSPFERAAAAERRELLRQRIQSWPPTERGLATLLLEGEAETVTAAAWLYREREEARGEPGTMYPQKARGLLDARRQELEELV